MSSAKRVSTKHSERKAPNDAKEDTRERLIAAAVRLFAQKGFDGASVKELADAAGVNVSLVSYHFGGKENLYRSCLEQFGRKRLAVTHRLLQPPSTLEEMRLRLGMFVEEIIIFHLEERDVTRIVHRECEMELPIAQDVFRETFVKVFETVQHFFESAQKQKLIDPSLDPHITAQIFMGSVLQFAKSNPISEKIFGKSLHDKKHRDRVLLHIVRNCLHGCALQARESSHERNAQ